MAKPSATRAIPSQLIEGRARSGIGAALDQAGRRVGVTAAVAPRAQAARQLRRVGSRADVGRHRRERKIEQRLRGIRDACRGARLFLGERHRAGRGIGPLATSISYSTTPSA